LSDEFPLIGPTIGAEELESRGLWLLRRGEKTGNHSRLDGPIIARARTGQALSSHAA
jgi:hypothetical protein